MTDTAFEQLIMQYQKLVYTVCYQLTRDPQTAEDLAQETFLSAYLHRDSCSSETVKPWLCRIATNKAKDHLKSAYHRRVELAGEEEEAERPHATAPPAEELVVDRSMQQLIEGKIRALKEPYLKVSVLFFLEQRTVEEIARQLGRPPKTVHTQLYRARQLLQKQLRQEEAN